MLVDEQKIINDLCRCESGGVTGDSGCGTEIRITGIGVSEPVACESGENAQHGSGYPDGQLGGRRMQGNRLWCTSGCAFKQNTRVGNKAAARSRRGSLAKRYYGEMV